MNHRIAAAILVIALPLLAQADEINPAKVKSILPQLEKHAQAGLKKTGVPGLAVAVVVQDQVVYLKGFGARHNGQPGQVDADTVFQMASVSKPMASTVLASLVSEGKITWDDRVIEHDPQFQLQDPWVTRQITLRDLLCHRSGMPGHAGDLLEDLGYSRRQIIHRLRFLKAATSLRTHYAYTNFLFTEAGEAGAKAAGTTWEKLAADKLYIPLGMKSTSSRFEDYARAKNRALLHVSVNGKFVAKFTRQPDAQAPAGGVSSTARDMAQWLRLQLGAGKYNGKQLIKAEALTETHKPQIVSGFSKESGRANFYGLGWGIHYDKKGRFFLRHAGAFSLGARTQVALLPEENVGIVVLANGYPTGLPEAVAQIFYDLLLEGKVERDWVKIWDERFNLMMKQIIGDAPDYSKPPAKPGPALEAAAYAGTYGNQYFGDIAITQKAGQLQLIMGPRKVTYTMKHWNRDVFVYTPTGESAEGPSSAMFEIGPKGRAVKVTLEELNVYGNGTFHYLPVK